IRLAKEQCIKNAAHCAFEFSPKLQSALKRTVSLPTSLATLSFLTFPRAFARSGQA
ncbi:3771_t:CDS:2, partial [Dentiscutata erythropus]